MATAHPPRQFHPIPVIGHPETWYKKHIEQADAAGDEIAHHAYKVGQYITLALEHHRPWEEKAKYFRHCLKHHTQPPITTDAETIAFFGRLKALVLRYASQDACRVAHREHESYLVRQDMGTTRDDLADEADAFFSALLDTSHSHHFLSEEAATEIRKLRDRWI